MTKKYLLLFNLVLAAVFAFKLFALNAEIGSEVIQKADSFDEAPIQVQRPSVKAAERYRNIFGVNSHEMTALPTDRSETEGYNELVTEDEIIRLRAVFITESESFAVISVSDKVTRGKEDELRVGIGEKVRGFTVSAIQSAHVSLSADSSEPLQLKIFKPLK